MGPPKTCILQVSMKAGREKSKGNGVYDSHLGTYYQLVNQQCCPFFCLAFLSLIICVGHILKVNVLFLVAPNLETVDRLLEAQAFFQHMGKLVYFF